MALDPNKPVQTDEGHEVEILRTDAVGDYPIIAMIKKGGNQYADSFDRNGVSATGDFMLVNTPAPAAPTVTDKSDSFTLPNLLQQSVMTRKKGEGVVTKVRNHPTRSMFVKPLNGQTPFWALNKNVSPL